MTDTPTDLTPPAFPPPVDPPAVEPPSSARDGHKWFQGPAGEWVEVPDGYTFGADAANPIPVVINGEVFYAANQLPPELFGQLLAIHATLPTEDDRKAAGAEGSMRTIEVMAEMTELFLLEESALRIAERFGDKERPIGVSQLMDVSSKLINERYMPQNPEDGAKEDPARPTPAASA